MCSDKATSEIAEAAERIGWDTLDPVSLPLVLTDVIDLTHPLDPSFPVVPAFQPLERTETHSIDVDGFASARLSFNEHSGTHIDAPAHFIAGGTTVDRLDPRHLIRPLCVITLRGHGDPDCNLTASDVERWERTHGTIPAGAVAAAHTGWSERAPGTEYLNLNGRTPHFPGYTSEAAELLILGRGVVGLGIDTPSIDPGSSVAFEAHHITLGAGAIAIENLANLDAAKPVGATMCIGALPISGGTGTPARILAIQ